MEEKELQQTAHVVRDASRAENLQHVKSNIWQNLPPAPPLTVPAHRWRTVLATGVAGMTIAGVAVAAATFWLPGAPMSPAPAFADVEKALEKIQTAQWTETYFIRDGKSTKLKRVGTEYNYLRLGHSPLLVVTDRPNAVNAGFRSFDDGATTLSVSGESPTYQYLRLDSRKPNLLNLSASPAEHLRTLILFPRDVNRQSPAAVVETEKRFNLSITKSHTPWVSKTDTLNGLPVVRWECVWTAHTPRHVDGGRVIVREGTNERTVRLWVDPKTARVLRREEITEVKSGRAKWRQVADNFQYDTPAPASVFRVPLPPVGAPYSYMDITSKGMKALRLLPDEKATVAQTIQETVAAWNRHDSHGVLRNWDTNSAKLAQTYYGNRVERNKEHQRWQRRVTKGIPYVQWRVRNIRYADYNPTSLYARHDEPAPFPPNQRPGNVSALAEGEGQLKSGGPWVPVDAVFVLHNDRDRFGITYINMYKGKMPLSHGKNNFK